MGARNALEAQRATYWQLLKLNQKIRKILEGLSSESFPPRLDGQAKQSKQKIDQLFGRYRRLVNEFRNHSYELKSVGETDCDPFLKHSTYSDPAELFPNWMASYGGPNYSFQRIRSDGVSIFPQEGRAFSGFWQLFENLLPEDDNRLELWPSYFGQSSSGNWDLQGQREILDELRFPLSGANLEGAIAVDLETSSLTPLKGEILEIGIVEIRGTDPLQWPRFSMRFDLSSELARSLGTGAEHIHGISAHELIGLPKISDPEIQKTLQSYLCTGRRLISHNSSFEFRWLSQYVDGFFEANYNRMGMQTSIDTGVLCKFAFSLAGGRGATGNSLRATIETLGLGYMEAHRAQADAAMAALSAHGMLRSTGMLQPRSLDDREYLKLLSGEMR